MTKMNQMLYLPSELIIQILLRLSVKSLLRFKCVCKSLFSLISDPHFANLHVDVSAARIVSISTTTRPLAEIHSIDFETSINHDSVLLDHTFLLPRRYFNYKIKIKGSCRGFIFLHCSTNLYIWNPSSRFHKEIPLSPFAAKVHAYDDHPRHLYGFGYDRLRDDYLVVLLSLGCTSLYLEFFSFRDNMWNEIVGPHITYLNTTDYPKASKAGLFLNGDIHWLASRYYHDIRVEVIVVFDLMERKLLEIPLPDDFDHDPVDYGLWVFGEFLSLWNRNFHNWKSTVEIWVMKEYKQHLSWTKSLVIPTIMYFSPIYSTKSGDIVGTDGDRGLVKYNNKRQSKEYLEMNPNASEVAIYTESLLSLPGDREQV